MIVTTLSMVITFLLHCNLKDTKANGCFIQNILIDTTRDILLHIRCFWNNEICMLFLNIYSYFYIIIVVSKNCKHFNIFDSNYDTFSFVSLLVFEIICINLLDIEKSTYSIRPIIYTIIYSLFAARFYDAFNLSCPLDIFTVYFLIWQIMFIITEWESDKLPLVSLTFYRVWLCKMPASMIFVIHDSVFRYLPIQVNFLIFWLIAFSDV